MGLPAGIDEALRRGATVVTGNRRAARTLGREYDRRRQAAGETAWAAAPVLAWEAWTRSLWDGMLAQGHAARLLLNRTQEMAVWRAVVAQDAAAAGAGSAASLAGMADQAWTALCAYRGEGRLRDAGVSADTRAFGRWARAFAERCEAEDYVSGALLERELAAGVLAGTVPVAEAGYALVGFDGLTPARQGLLAAIEARGGRVERVAVGCEAETPLLLAAATEREEMECAALWLREAVKRNAGARVALIVPGLEGRRAELDRRLRAALAPGLNDIVCEEDAPYEFSLGGPVGQTPMVAAALGLLRWTAGPLPLDRVSGLLLSPFFGGDAERLERAAFDAGALRGGGRPMLRPELSLDETMRRAAQWGSAVRAPRLIGTLRAMRRAVVESFAGGERRSHADWTDMMRSVLRAAEWSGGQDSVAFQIGRRWESLLDQVATLDFTGVRVGFGEALEAVERLARETPFAPESRDAPVQVMGPLEAAGSSFDAVWMMGAGETSWPLREAGSPLVSRRLQRELGMPGSDRAAETERARAMTERIARCGGAVVFSYAIATGDGTQRVSAAVAELGPRAFAAAELTGLQQPVPPRIELEAAEESAPLPPLPDRVMTGGAAVLKAQAACGFRAFAEQRLWAKGVEEVELGMDARERGSVVHAVLEDLWKEVRSQAALKAMSGDERRAALEGSVGRALPRSEGADAWERAYVEVQRSRLMKLLGEWLELEIVRKMPFTVKVNELTLRDVPIGPLRLSLRVDRIDETAFGEVIIDYKTGDVQPKAWLGERPDEPQVPLYALSAVAAGSTLAGVAFGRVQAGGKMTLTGYEKHPNVLVTVPRNAPHSLEAQVTEWSEALTGLAEDFARGDVRVRPKAYPGTCAYCGLRPLCRLDVASLDAVDEDDGDGEGGEDDRG